MLAKEVKQLDRLQRLIYWITERENIHQKRLAKKPWPWTDDPILRQYRFCNVVRIEDKVSQWLVDNWYAPNYNHKNMLLACALARFINKIETLECIGFPKVWDTDRIAARLRLWKNTDHTVFGAAYVIRGNSGTDKIDAVVNYYVDPLKNIEIDRDSMQGTWNILHKCYGFGSFMAGQVTADLRWAAMNTWKDRKTWAPIGPGSQRGTNRLLGRPLNRLIRQKEFDVLLEQMIADVKPKLSKTLTSRMEAIDWQSCLCEYDKFSRALEGQGTPKQLFRSRT